MKFSWAHYQYKPQLMNRLLGNFQFTLLTNVGRFQTFLHLALVRNYEGVNVKFKNNHILQPIHICGINGSWKVKAT